MKNSRPLPLGSSPYESNVGRLGRDVSPAPGAASRPAPVVSRRVSRAGAGRTVGSGGRTCAAAECRVTLSLRLAVAARAAPGAPAEVRVSWWTPAWLGRAVSTCASQGERGPARRAGHGGRGGPVRNKPYTSPVHCDSHPGGCSTCSKSREPEAARFRRVYVLQSDAGPLRACGGRGRGRFQTQHRQDTSARQDAISR